MASLFSSLSLFTKRVEHKARYVVVCMYGRWARKSLPTVWWTVLSVVCILRGSKDIDTSVSYVFCRAVSWFFNTLPRAALEILYRGAEIENNILNRASAPVLFLRSGRERKGQSKSERVKLPRPFKSTKERRSPWGSRESYSPRAISCKSSVV